jgi:hypothetical protein
MVKGSAQTSTAVLIIFLRLMVQALRNLFAVTLQIQTKRLRQIGECSCKHQ